MALFSPKNPCEARIRDITLCRYKVLDLMDRYPETTDACLKLISGVARAWQTVKYAGAAVGGFASGAALGSAIPGVGTLVGGIIGATTAVSGVYATQRATETAIDTTVTSTSNAAATQITSDAPLQKEFASTIKICELGLLCAVTPKAAKALKGTLKTQATALKRINPLAGKVKSTTGLGKTETGKEWKNKIHGKPQKTKTAGHDWQSMREGIKKAKDPDVAEVHFDRRLDKITGGKVSSQMRPDVTTVRNDERLITDEIPSKSQTVPQLQRKIQKMQNLLPSEMRGPEEGGRVINIKK